MWLVGDHFVFAHGSVNALEDQLFMIDSGSPGAGFGPDAKTVEAAHMRTMRKRREQESAAEARCSSFRPSPTSCVSRMRVSTTSRRVHAGRLAARIFSFRVAGMVSDEYLARYAVTYDFNAMRVAMTS